MEVIKKAGGELSTANGNSCMQRVVHVFSDCNP